MNEDFNNVFGILSEFKSEYMNLCPSDVIDPNTPITERDIVSEIYCRLKGFCENRELYPHTEIKPAPSENVPSDELKGLPRIDVVILKNKKNSSWLSSAIKIQNGYTKGKEQARFSAVPVKFFHTAIEVKIQSNVRSVKKDIDTLSEKISKKNKSCNCFMVLLNARGRRKDHKQIIRYSEEKKGIYLIEYTSR